MARQQLQVTALRPQARAMDTYVRPEVQKNADAIGKLLQSIDKTDNDRAMKNAEINAVTEAMGQGPEDLHSREGMSTRPDAVAYRFEQRGLRYAIDSLPESESAFQEFLLGSNDMGTDIEPFLDELYGGVMSKINNGGGSQFLMAGAGETLINARADMQKRHMEYIDKRAREETISNLSMRVDGIVHQKLVNNRPDGMGGTLPPQPLLDRIADMDALAVEMSMVTHLTKGQANKAVFESLLAMAAGNEPENAERYLHMAKLVRYAKGKNGELRPEAFEAISLAEDAADRKINSKAIADAAALKVQQEKDKVEASTSLIKHLTETEGAVVSLAPEQQQMLAAAGISVEKQNAMLDATNKMKTGGQESQTQEDNWVKLSLNLAANRQNPDMGSSYSQFMNMVAEKQIHPSRLKEALTMLKGIEQAAPLINNLLNTQPRNLWVASIVKMEEGEYDIVGLTKKEQLITEWNNEMNKLLGLHYDDASTENMAPTTSQLQSMADHVKGVMSNNYADEIAERDLDENGFRDYKAALDLAVSQSKEAPAEDKITAFYINNVGTSGQDSFTGNLSVDAIEEDITDVMRLKNMFNPMREFTSEDVQEADEEEYVGKTNWQIFELRYGPRSFHRWYKRNKPSVITMAHYKGTIEE